MRKKITEEQLDDIERRAGFRCEICGVDQLPSGLLCRSCNLGLGSFRDSMLLLYSAADYLKRKSIRPSLKAKHITPGDPHHDKPSRRRAERIAWWAAHQRQQLRMM